jgi:hypothetical protein
MLMPKQNLLMLSRTRKIWALIILFSYILPWITSFIFIQYQKIQIKSLIKKSFLQEIKKEELFFFQFTIDEKSKLNFEHSKEFELDGQMYDIVYEEVRGDTVQYWCWWDYEETQLNKKLTNLLNNTLEDVYHLNFIKDLKKDFFSYVELKLCLPLFFVEEIQIHSILLERDFCNSLNIPPEAFIDEI